MTGIKPRQQVQQLCNQLAASNRIRRESIDKVGKRRKIHNFPVTADHPGRTNLVGNDSESWRRRLSALVAATGRPEKDLLDDALQLLALKVLQNN
jgi:hypothetical protein